MISKWENTVSQASAISDQETNLDTVKIPPRVMFGTQIYGTLIGAIVNYAVMISIVNNNREVLAENGVCMVSF